MRMRVSYWPISETSRLSRQLKLRREKDKKRLIVWSGCVKRLSKLGLKQKKKGGPRTLKDGGKKKLLPKNCDKRKLSA
jgi:hypothetical protein